MEKNLTFVATCPNCWKPYFLTEQGTNLTCDEGCRFRGFRTSTKPISELEEQKIKLHYEILSPVYSFLDQYETPFVAVKANGVRRTMPADSPEFRRWLLAEYVKRTGGTASREAINTLAFTCEARAQSSGKRHDLWVRAARVDDAFWIDLGDETWSAIKITKSGWSIELEPPILFRRHKHMKPLSVAAHGTKEDFDALKKLLPLKEENDLLLWSVTRITQHFPGHPQPIEMIYGAQGGAKSTLTIISRRIIDDSSIALLTMPHDRNELIQQLNHHYVPAYDNVHGLSQAQSDAICRAVTGDGNSKRSLYSNDDDFVYSHRRCPMFNGLNLAGTAPDLLDRAITYRCERIPKTQRKRQELIETKFNELLPKVRAFIYETAVKALQLAPQVPETNLPRMADYARYGEAAAQALGYEPGEFLRAYEANQQNLSKTSVQENLLGDLILAYHDKAGDFDGTPTEFYKKLQEHAANENINLKTENWPKDVSAMSRDLTKLSTPFADMGYLLLKDFSDSTKKKRRIVFRKIYPLSFLQDFPAITQANGKPSKAYSKGDQALSTDFEPSDLANLLKQSVVEPVKEVIPSE